MPQTNPKGLALGQDIYMQLMGILGLPDPIDVAECNIKITLRPGSAVLLHIETVKFISYQQSSHVVDAIKELKEKDTEN